MGSIEFVFERRAAKAKIWGAFAGLPVATVTFYVTKITESFSVSAIIGVLDDTITLLLSDKVL